MTRCPAGLLAWLLVATSSAPAAVMARVLTNSGVTPAKAAAKSPVPSPSLKAATPSITSSAPAGAGWRAGRASFYSKWPPPCLPTHPHLHLPPCLYTVGTLACTHPVGTLGGVSSPLHPRPTHDRETCLPCIPALPMNMRCDRDGLLVLASTPCPAPPYPPPPSPPLPWLYAASH